MNKEVCKACFKAEGKEWTNEEDIYWNAGFPRCAREGSSAGQAMSVLRIICPYNLEHLVLGHDDPMSVLIRNIVSGAYKW